MSDYTKLIFGDTAELYMPATLQEVGRPLQMTMQGLNPDTSYFAYAELYENGVKTAQSLQQTFQTIRAGVITLTHVSDVRYGNNYVVTYSVSNTYALSSSIMSINGSPIQGVISGNTITYTVSGLTMGQTYSYSISTIDFYGETDTTTGSLVTVAQNYINIAYSSRTSSSVTFDLDYVSDGGFYEGYIEYWSSEKDPSTEQADGHTFFQNGADTVMQTNLEEGTEYKFRATILQSVGGTEIQSSVVTQSTEAHDYSGDYFTITSTSANNTIYFKSVVHWTTGSIDYSTDNGSTWTTVSGGTSGNGNTLATLGIGDKLILRSTKIKGGDNKLNASGSYTVSGNLASLQFGDNFNVSGQTAQEFGGFFKQNPVTSAKDLYLGAYSTMGTYSFKRLFDGCTSLTTPPSSLPATTMAEGCYTHMFEKCTSLTTAPTLPTTTLAQGCYSYMFSGCTSLTSAPALQATTLESSCYEGMFRDCTSLTTAPTLPTTTLAQGCCSYMFAGCTSLTTAPTLPATTLVISCYASMFKNCTSLTSAPALPATTMAEDCYAHMFENCTSLTTAPTLPTTTLAQGCYSYMFSGCTSLTTAPTLPATTLVRSGYASMFAGCTSLTSAPALQATTLDFACYEGMFTGCTSLTTAPTLPTTTLAQACYYKMFQGCTSLTSSPDLRQVTSIGTNSMQYMFSGCTSLSVAYAPTPSSWETEKMKDWLYGVAASGTLFADPSIAASIPTDSSSGCPSGWSVGAVSDEFFNYFTIKNESENDNTISLWAESHLAERDVDISVDGGKTWTAYTAKRNPGQPVAKLSAGEEMLARHIGTIGDPHYISFRSSDKISAHGNVASLQFGDNFKKINQTIPSTQFNGLFIGSEYLIDASKLSFESYTATQGLGLYRAFEMCTSLIEPPDFSRITSVDNDRSFFQTFYGCSSLTKVYAPSPSVWDSVNTYHNWLYGVAASGTIYANPTTAASIPTDSSSGCPSGWRISTT